MTQRKNARRIVDLTACPGGPQGQFGRKFVSQIDQLTQVINDLTTRLEALEGAEPVESAGGGGSTRFPRKKITNGSGDPYEIPWEEEGYAYDDVGATADVYLKLPDSSTFEDDNNEWSPFFLFHRTTAHNVVIQAQGSDVIHVDLTTQSAAAGNVALREANSCVGLRLMDTGWRAFQLNGSWEIDYTP